MQKKSYLLVPVVGVMLSLSFGCASNEPYVVVEEGSGLFRSGKKMSTSAEQWEYASATRESGSLKKAARRMLYLVRRWPSSKEAPLAARAYADILLERGQLKAAFDAYQDLIDNYSGRMEEYDTVLEAQFNIAKLLMEKRRMVWAFGGYATPGAAVDYYEEMIRNGPQSAHSPEAQFLVGQCHQAEKEYEQAILAYQILGYRYPDSPYAEEGAWQQVQCLQRLHEEYPRSPELRERLLTSTTLFVHMFPKSTYGEQILKMRNELYEMNAQAMFDLGTYYAEIARNPEAAILYDEALIEEFSMSTLVPLAKKRIGLLNASMSNSSEE